MNVIKENSPSYSMIKLRHVLYGHIIIIYNFIISVLLSHFAKIVELPFFALCFGIKIVFLCGYICKGTDYHKNKIYVCLTHVRS